VQLVAAVSAVRYRSRRHVFAAEFFDREQKVALSGRHQGLSDFGTKAHSEKQAGHCKPER
jgi:hypothetical protein